MKNKKRFFVYFAVGFLVSALVMVARVLFPATELIPGLRWVYAILFFLSLGAILYNSIEIKNHRLMPLALGYVFGLYAAGFWLFYPLVVR